MNISIALDAMGGDFGPEVVVPAALGYLKKQKNVRLMLVGLPDKIQEALDRHEGTLSDRLEIVPASQVVGMDEEPKAALKNKKQSSMRIALDMVKEKKADACVSAGNTGALMATSRFVLKMLPGVERPAICSFLPTSTGSVCVLDLGANVNCTALNLLQFAIMGSILVSAVEHIESPTVALLNIGEEAIKGNEVVKEAGELLRNSGLNFCGNVEGDGIFFSGYDVVVCDGFVGNVALKVIEGAAKLFAQFLRKEFSRTFWTKLAALCAIPVMRAFKRRFDPRHYNGAMLLGLKGIVVKSHGSADIFSYTQAIHRAVEEVRGGVLDKIAVRVENHMRTISDTSSGDSENA